MRLALFAFLLPTVALADCPTANDLKTGIQTTERRGYVDIFKRQSQHLVRNDHFFERGSGSRTVLAKGIYMIQSDAIDQGRVDRSLRSTFRYDRSPAQMPVPTPGARWTSDVVRQAGQNRSRSTHDMQFGRMTKLKIGACTYDSVPVTVRYGKEGEAHHYLPELGIALIAYFDNGSRKDRYRYTKIEAVK